MSDSPSQRLIRVIGENVRDAVYGHVALSVYDLLEEGFKAGYRLGLYEGSALADDGNICTFEEWMSGE